MPKKEDKRRKDHKKLHNLIIFLSFLSGFGDVNKINLQQCLPFCLEYKPKTQEYYITPSSLIFIEREVCCVIELLLLNFIKWSLELTMNLCVSSFSLSSFLYIFRTFLSSFKESKFDNQSRIVE